MSTRAQVKIVQHRGGEVYLYQHSDGYDLPNTVRKALQRGVSRWDDPEYLARIIFNEMTEDDAKGTLGYGIGTEQHGDIEWLVIVDVPNQTVEVLHDGESVTKERITQFVESTKVYE